MLWARLCMVERGVSVRRPFQGPPKSCGGLKFYWSMNSRFCLIFYHPEHSLEGSRLNSCTCVVVLLVMVASTIGATWNCIFNRGLNFFWSMKSWFCLTIDHPEHSLEGSRLNSCTCVVVLVVMIASSHWSYLNFYFYFSSSEACLSLAVHAWEGGLGAETLPRPPKF
jgi:hypothetical protein